VSDCEGPISKNDNAFELTQHFVSNGDKLFSIISKYDDVLVDIVKRKSYNAGDTLKLILPFLKACDITDKQIEEFSAHNLVFIAGSKETLKHITRMAEAFIVSTSYEQYIKKLCEALDFPFENTYCTRLNIDKYKIPVQEKSKLKSIAKEIASMPMITIPREAKSVRDFSIADQETVKRLDEIFWKEISNMRCGVILSEVKPVGGKQKAEAILDIVKKLKLPLSNVIYVGDSITDVEAFQLVKSNGGLAVSFNGNNYAIKNAEIAIMSENNIATALIADVFLGYGKAKALQIAEAWNTNSLEHSSANPILIERYSKFRPKALPKVQIVTAKNMEALSKESSEFRKKVRGEAVGKLG